MAAEAAGWDGVWTWDHLLAIQGPWEQPIFEGWMALAAVAAVTRRVTVGLMVGANTFRQPGLTAKLATTLDHISDGRADPRHRRRLVRARARRLRHRLRRRASASGSTGSTSRSAILRRLLDGERFSHHGRATTRSTTPSASRGPSRPTCRSSIGGSGPQKTLRTVARRADAWNTSGTIEEVTRNRAILGEHCAAVGRDPAEIELTVSFPIVIRDTEAAARRGDRGAAAGTTASPRSAACPTWPDRRRRSPRALRPYVDLGFRHVIVRMPAPYDRETIDRLPELRAALADVPVGA